MAAELDKQSIDEMMNVVTVCQEEVTNNYLLVKQHYINGYDSPELDPLRHEVCLCLIYGLPQAAITLTNHLLEAFLKCVLSYHHTSSQVKKDDHGKGVHGLVEILRPGNKLYSNMDLSKTIDQACSKGLITKEHKKQFHVFREVYRNAFSHADKRKTFGETEIPVQGISIDNGIEPVSYQQIFDLPFTQGLAQVNLARENALPYFQYVDNVIRETLLNLYN